MEVDSGGVDGAGSTGEASGGAGAGVDCAGDIVIVEGSCTTKDGIITEARVHEAGEKRFSVRHEANRGSSFFPKRDVLHFVKITLSDCTTGELD